MMALEILAHINDNVDLDEFKYWTKDDIVEWVRYNYPCTMKVARDVASQLVFIVR